MASEGSALNLLTLPLEIRLRIYHYYLLATAELSLCIVNHCANSKDGQPRQLPAVCKQIAEEQQQHCLTGRETEYRPTTLRLHSDICVGEMLLRRLQGIDICILEHISHIRLTGSIGAYRGWRPHSRIRRTGAVFLIGVRYTWHEGTMWEPLYDNLKESLLWFVERHWSVVEIVSISWMEKEGSRADVDVLVRVGGFSLGSRYISPFDIDRVRLYTDSFAQRPIPVSKDESRWPSGRPKRDEGRWSTAIHGERGTGSFSLSRK